MLRKLAAVVAALAIAAGTALTIAAPADAARYNESARYARF